MSEEPVNESLHKEFELERMILFSDAVFAIAITLLILEIKFPELPPDFKSIDFFGFFKPTLIHFFAFIISFFFIGISWARHLHLCKFLKRYNNGVIFLNLLLLFFIVTFPFSVSGFAENMHQSLLIPIVVYIFNIFFVTFAQYLFARYIIIVKTELSVSAYADEKKYFLMRSRYNFIMMLATIIVILTSAIITKGDPEAVSKSLYVLPVFLIIMRIKLRKYKPQKAN